MCPLADSCIASAAREASSVAELAASKKMDKYISLAADYLFQPIAVEMLGSVNESASHFLTVWRTKLANVLDTSGRLTFYFSIPVLLQQYRVQQHSASRFVCS